jgi:hypothetical protein
MYNVSEAYKEQINKRLRNLSYMRVYLGVIEPDASVFNTMSDNGHSYLSNLQETDAGRVVNKRYLTMEHNKCILDGKGILPPELADPVLEYQGFVSNAISGSDGVFSVPPTITINFSQPFAFVGLTFRFDRIHGTYPTELQITAFNGAAQIYDNTVNPTSYEYWLESDIPDVGQFCTSLVIKFKKTFPRKRRAVLEYIMFGIVKTFTDDTLIKSTWNRNTDLLSTKIPTNSFEFTIMDVAKDYNPDNAQGFWQYIEQRQPVSFEYGYELDDGSTEWISGGHLLTSGEISTDSTSVISKTTFKATSVLNQLTNKYYKGIYSAVPVSLYDLAVDVLEFAQLPLLHDGSTPYSVDTALQSISTTVPIPELQINEALQLVSNAGRCILGVDRDGRVVIERMVEIESDFSLGFEQIDRPPSLSKLPSLLTVSSYYTVLEVDNVESMLTSNAVSFVVATECRLTYEPSTAQRITVDGTLAIVGTPIYYATSALVTLSGTGTVAVPGKLLKTTKVSVTNVAGETGYDCPIENKLLNSKADATDYVAWIASILTRRNLYTAANRGYPELDVLDLISVDTLFTKDANATVSASTIEYNGALSGSTSYILAEEGV